MIFPLNSLEELTLESLQDLEAMVARVLEQRLVLCESCGENEYEEYGPDGERLCSDCYTVLTMRSK